MFVVCMVCGVCVVWYVSAWCMCVGCVCGVVCVFVCGMYMCVCMCVCVHGVCGVCVCGGVCVVCIYEFVCGASSVTHTNTNTEHTHEEVINTNSRRNTCSCFTNRSCINGYLPLSNTPHQAITHLSPSLTQVDTSIQGLLHNGQTTYC